MNNKPKNCQFETMSTVVSVQKTTGPTIATITDGRCSTIGLNPSPIWADTPFTFRPRVMPMKPGVTYAMFAKEGIAVAITVFVPSITPPKKAPPIELIPPTIASNKIGRLLSRL